MPSTPPLPQVEEPNGISSFFRNLFYSQQSSSPLHEASEPQQPNLKPQQLNIQPQQPNPPSVGAIKPSGFVKKDDDIYIK